jgi:hypothetical protein
VQLPAELEPAPEDPNGGGRLVATTNLPEGTMVSITYGILDAGGESSGGGGGITGLAVEDGELSAMINNQSCYYLVGRQATSAGVDVTVTVSPVPVGPISVPAGYEVDSSQPPEVLEVLGEDFEHLTGPQVRTEDGVRELVATGSYAWPADSCAGTREQFVPAVCEPTQGQLQGDDLEQAVGEVMGAIGQGRLCEIWQLALPPEIEAEHPWDAFRREWSEWLSGSLGDVTQPDDPYSSALTWELVSQDDTGYTVEVSLRGTPVATLTFVPLPDWPGASDPGVVPFWGLIDYTLFDV